MRHPEALFSKEVEYALINPQNLYILKPHLLCAAWELPLKEEDEDIFGPSFVTVKRELEEGGFLKGKGGRWYLSPAIPYPAQRLNLRATTEKAFSIMDISQGSLLETVEASVAFLQIHPGAIYLHQGEAYLIKELDLISRTAYALPIDADYYTQPLELSDVHILKVTNQREVKGVNIYLGEVEVSQQVIGFKKKRQFTEEVIGMEALDLPPYIYDTVALWFDLPPIEEGLDLAGGLHALEHAAIALLPLFALCDRNDIGGLSTPAHPDTGKSQVFIYDAYPGGIGIAEKGFELIDKLWSATLKVIEECPCKEGCPSCIQSPKCGNNNQPLDKKAAQTLLQLLTSGKIH
jgi:DEAD/DEAH box helicase domain-containing protein